MLNLFRFSFVSEFKPKLPKRSSKNSLICKVLLKLVGEVGDMKRVPWI